MDQQAQGPERRRRVSRPGFGDEHLGQAKQWWASFPGGGGGRVVVRAWGAPPGLGVSGSHEANLSGRQEVREVWHEGGRGGVTQSVQQVLDLAHNDANQSDRHAPFTDDINLSLH